MSSNNLPNGDGPDDDLAKRREIETLLRQVPPDEQSQLQAFALIQAFRREALLGIAGCLDRRSKERAVEWARQRLKENLCKLFAISPDPDEGC